MFCQVYRGGRSWYPSHVADDAPYRNAVAMGFDPLGETIRVARTRGQRVHAWVNVLRVYQNPDAPLVKVVGRPAVQTDSYQNSLLDYDKEGNPPSPTRGFSLGTPGIWLDPSEPGVRAHIVESVKDLVLRYPDLDGVHLDMVRFPMAIRTNYKTPFNLRPEFGFSSRAVHRFYVFSGRTPPGKVTPELAKQLVKSKAWAAWRRAQVTLLVYEIREMLLQVAPHMELSAAVIANQDRAVNRAFQDWPTWISSGLLDVVVPMNYTKKLELFNRLSKAAVVSAKPKRIFMGIGAWLMRASPQTLITEGKGALSHGADGVTLFSYSNLFDARGQAVLTEFQRSVFPTTN